MTVRRRPWLIVLALGVTCGLPAAGWCQQPSPTRDRPPGRRELAAAELLRRLDRNRDGVLQPEEIPRGARLQMALAARRRGLDPRKPLPLAELTRSIESPRAKPVAPAKPTPTEARGQSKEEPKPSVGSDGSGSVRVPGFGVPDDRSPVPGFDVPDDRSPVPGFDVPPPAASVSKTDSSGERRGGEESASSTPSADRRIRRYAKSMLAQYDKNKNGQLERDEWSRMRGKPKEADRNGDDVLSLDELAGHLAGYGSRRDAPAGSRSGTGAGASYRSQKAEGTRRTYRFLSPHERLPKGLPDWFARKDADLDGQVSMAEFSTAWPRGKLEEFARLDLNGDGFIVPKECLRATTQP